MRFCLFTAGEDQAPARMCLETIRYHHADATVVHLTDLQSDELRGADEVWRSHWNGSMQTIMGLRMTHLATLDDAPTVVLDTDILLRRPLYDVWRKPFQVALTKREHPVMPYNTGVMFSRCGDFWRAVLHRMDDDHDFRAFLTEQLAVKAEAESGKWKVADLDCDEWNCANVNSVSVPPARVLHYKGARKKWQVEHYERGVWR